ncbi:hypothetical protein VOLCADRAFT_92577 [Volvox carteri f. nagariensis]|uniref:CCHC-type domain-containing protein n=1 Tax=Volvox carteri f. nagariensis TaxID=3068 RepID=D8U009_VOLCA|nr:uncharacterized protein VOLCADRAFT_92577 [Volvox carteri f. nagariensis]EFJ47025.1 hypothetical protein VOLCADRAFT_92577 [Volvox carteri f. nagariensis]|eukprot:XP_002951920.1 hypothetical protein VOLCADRAFT_92577 [Volvox carteri f. nagariensis]
MPPFDHLRTITDCDRELVAFPPLSSDEIDLLQRVEDQLLAIDEALAADLGQQEEHLPARASKSAKEAHTAKIESTRRKYEAQRSRILRANPSFTDLKTRDAARLAIQERKLQLVSGVPPQGWHPLPNVVEEDAAAAAEFDGTQDPEARAQLAVQVAQHYKIASEAQQTQKQLNDMSQLLPYKEVIRLARDGDPRKTSLVACLASLSSEQRAYLGAALTGQTQSASRPSSKRPFAATLPPEGGPQEGPEDITCLICNQRGHRFRNCPQLQAMPRDQQQAAERPGPGGIPIKAAGAQQQADVAAQRAGPAPPQQLELVSDAVAAEAAAAVVAQASALVAAAMIPEPLHPAPGRPWFGQAGSKLVTEAWLRYGVNTPASRNAAVWTFHTEPNPSHHLRNYPSILPHLADMSQHFDDFLASGVTEQYDPSRQRYAGEVTAILEAAATGPVRRGDLQTLAGRLTFVARACRWGYTFLQGIYDALGTLQYPPPSSVALPEEALDDLRFWQDVLRPDSSVWDGVKRCVLANLDLAPTPVVGTAALLACLRRRVSAHAVGRYATSTVTGTLSALADWQRFMGVSPEAYISRDPLVKRTLGQALRRTAAGPESAPSMAKAPLPLGVLRLLVAWLRAWLGAFRVEERLPHQGGRGVLALFLKVTKQHIKGSGFSV